MALKLIAFFVLSIVAVTLCDHLILGEVNGKHIIHHTVEQYNTIPFTKREKQFFYSEPNQKIINVSTE